jgi:hypothetical protein
MVSRQEDSDSPGRGAPRSEPGDEHTAKRIPRPRTPLGDPVTGRALRLARCLVGCSQREYAFHLHAGAKAFGKYETGYLRTPPQVLQDASERAGLPRMTLTLLADAAHGRVALTDEVRAELGAELLAAVLAGLARRGIEPGRDS